MHKCIMVKIGEGSKKVSIKQKKRKFCGNRGMYKFGGNGGIYNFLGNRGICNMHHWLRGMDAPGQWCVKITITLKV